APETHPSTCAAASMARPAWVRAAFRQVRLSSAWLFHRKYELAAVNKAINLKSQYENRANSTSVLRLTLTVRRHNAGELVAGSAHFLGVALAVEKSTAMHHHRFAPTFYRVESAIRQPIARRRTSRLSQPGIAFRSVAHGFLSGGSAWSLGMLLVYSIERPPVCPGIFWRHFDFVEIVDHAGILLCATVDPHLSHAERWKQASVGFYVHTPDPESHP